MENEVHSVGVICLWNKVWRSKHHVVVKHFTFGGERCKAKWCKSMVHSKWEFYSLPTYSNVYTDSEENLEYHNWFGVSEKKQIQWILFRWNFHIVWEKNYFNSPWLESRQHTLHFTVARVYMCASLFDYTLKKAGSVSTHWQPVWPLLFIMEMSAHCKADYSTFKRRWGMKERL